MKIQPRLAPYSRSVVLAYAGLFALAALLPAAEKKEPPLENYIDFSAGYVLQEGDRPGFQKAHQLNKSGFGGIDGLYMTKALDDSTNLVLIGRALAGNNDYLLDLTITRDDVGFLKFGYQEFRVWYDGSGGYLPFTKFRRQLYDEDLAIDRGHLWFEAGYLPEDKLNFSLRYDLFTRDGTKDSTSWGDTGLAVNAANTRGLLPTFLKIDEKRHQLTAEVSQSAEKSDWALAVRLDKGDYNNSRNERRRAGEPQDRKLTHKEGQDYDLFQVRGAYANQIHEKLLVTTAVARTTIDTTLSGSRIYGQDYDPVYDAAFLNRQQRDEGFLQLHGESEMKQTIGTLSARYEPRETLVIVPSVRFETIDWSNRVEFEETNFGAANTGFAPINDEVEADSEKDWQVVAASLEARYTGVKHVSLNLKGEWTNSEGDLSEQRIIEPGTALQAISIDRDTRFERDTQKFAATANWYPQPGTTVAVQYYYKTRANDYRAIRDNTVSSADRYPAYVANQDFETNDFNVRLSTKLGPTLRSVTRYDYQKSTIMTQDVGLAFGESANMTSHILSETVSWSVSNRWYLQGGANLVWDTLRTPAASLTGAAGGLVKNSDANYTALTLGSGYALDDQSDLFVDYSLMQSKDSFVDNSNRTVAYGSDAKTQVASATWTRKLDRRTSVSLKYAYAKNEDVPSGGFADYEAHLLYGKLQYRF